MSSIAEIILEMNQVAGLSKHQKIQNGVISAIDNHLITPGDTVPSVNALARTLGWAPRTVAKAYSGLKEMGVLVSRSRQGYFVSEGYGGPVDRVMLFLYQFGALQKTFYDAFVMAIGENVQVDAYFHHNDLRVFKAFISDNMGKYGMYLVAPIERPEARKVLEMIPASKLLMVDRHVPIGEHFSYIAQDFECYIFRGLEQLKEPILGYEEIVLFYRPDSDYPVGTLRAFRRFVEKHEIAHRIENMYMPGTVRRGCVYFTVNDADLWELLIDCERKELEVGKDVGVMAEDDTPAKKIIRGGITTISADFVLMAQKAAEAVLTKKPVREILPGQVIRRRSL